MEDFIENDLTRDEMWNVQLEFLIYDNSRMLSLVERDG